jgi:hypothetical protein
MHPDQFRHCLQSGTAARATLLAQYLGLDALGQLGGPLGPLLP